MPNQAPVFRPWGARTQQGRKRDHDRRRRRSQPWRHWYKLPLWQARRAEQLAREPRCERHLARGEIVAANTANHREPHRGDWDKFAFGPLESLCAHCHNSDVQREERASPGPEADEADEG